MTPIIIKEQKERSVSKGGNSPIFYLPKKYFTPGETVGTQLEIDHDGTVRVVLTKSLFNFTCDGVRKFVNEKLNVEYDKTVAGVRVLNAVKGNLGLSCTQSTYDLEPTHVTVSRRFNEIRSPKEYAALLEFVNTIKEKNFDAYLEPEGDLDALSVYREPETHGLKNEFEAIEALRETGKSLDFSVVVRFDNKKNTMDEISWALKELAT